MTDTPKLLGCPFCGGKARYVEEFSWASCGSSKCVAYNYATTVEKWNTRAQASDGALTNEAFCYTTPGMVEVAKAIKAGSGVGRVGAKLVKGDRFCVPLHLSPPAPASVILPPAPELPEEPPFADDDSHMDAYHAACRMRTACAVAIAAAGIGLKFEP